LPEREPPSSPSYWTSTLSTTLADYDYHLPPELIAQEPAPRREDARLLVVDRSTKTLQHRHIYDLPSILKPRDLLIFNNSRVIPARLYGRRASTGGKWEGLFLTVDTTTQCWEFLAKSKGYLHEGEWINLLDRSSQLALYRLQVTGRTDDRHLLVKVDPAIDPLQLLEDIGHIPLPHYIRDGQDNNTDRERYQTVYAAIAGSVAAPTAGLHFTPELLSNLQQQGVEQAFVTLHVGIGTFVPIKVDDLSHHVMHTEWCQVPHETLVKLKSGASRRIAVGTTTVRTLESAVLANQLSSPFSAATNLFIQPGHQFRAIDGMLTNFHLPRSTLLVLVSAFAGVELMRAAYAEAVRERYRFFSYGDAMLIL
jgi:S-adenosylmethionine:tRNA ribosyltransferase-isomerase